MTLGISEVMPCPYLNETLNEVKVREVIQGQRVYILQGIKPATKGEFGSAGSIPALASTLKIKGSSAKDRLTLNGTLNEAKQVREV